MKKIQKYTPLFAIFLMGLSPSVQAVEKSNVEKDVFNNPEFQKIYQESPVITQLLINPKTKNNHFLNLFLGFALKCSLLPKDSPLKKEEYDKFLQKEIKKDGFKKEDIELFEDFFNRLQNLDAKEVINHIVPDTGHLRYIAYELAKDFIPLALHRGNKEVARYFYQKVTKYVPKESMRILDRIQNMSSFQTANMLNMQLIKHAVEYENADTIIQDLLGEPYHITQDDMDCAFLMGFDVNMLFRLFSNNTMKPSLEVVKEAVKYCDTDWRSDRSKWLSQHEDELARQADLKLNFLRFFIALREKQSNFDFNGAFKELSANVEEFPALGKVLDLILNDYLEGKIPTNKNSSITAFEDYKNTRVIRGDNPKIQRAVTNQFNIGRGTPTGFKVSQLAKDLTLQIKDRRTNLNSLDGMGVIMQYVDPSAQHTPEMSDGGKNFKAEKAAEEKLKKQMDSGEGSNTHQHIETAAADQNGEEQINTMGNPAEILEDNTLSQQTISFKNNDEESKDSQ